MYLCAQVPCNSLTQTTCHSSLSNVQEMVNVPPQVAYVMKIGWVRLVIIIIERLVMVIDFKTLFKLIVNAVKVLLVAIIVRLSSVIMIVQARGPAIRIPGTVIVKPAIRGLIALFFLLLLTLFDLVKVTCYTI